MKSRRSVAVCVTSYNWEYESRVVEGVRQQCAEDDINLFVFSNLITRPELGSDRIMPENTLRGETEIYNLINYDILDGIIILGDSMINKEITNKIAAAAAEKGVKTVNVNDPENLLEYNVQLSDKAAMELVVSHLIEEHGFTKINFIGGFPGNFQTEERLAAYKHALATHNIPYDERRVGYGNFWKKAGECTLEFLDSGVPFDAIVCASDTMAFFAMDALKERNIRIPEDIAVTGFDGIADIVRYQPSLTSIRRAFIKAGREAVGVLERAWNGEAQPKITEVDSELIINKSCGCFGGRNDNIFFNKFYDERNHTLEFDYLISDMNTKFSDADNSKELFASISGIAKFFSLKQLYVCICSNIESGKINFHNGSEYEGLGENAVSLLEFGHGVPAGREFPVSELVPEDLSGREEAVFMAFVPLYFRNCFLGYLAFEPSKIEGCGQLFLTWTINISNNAGTFYMNKELQRVVNELRDINMTDPLTGICNRRGLNVLGRKLFESTSGYINIVCADVDGLKPINDTYGHEGGDNAITVVANAIKRSMPTGAVCARTGGDEFCAVFTSKTKDTAPECIKKVNEYLEEYNRLSQLPYKVGCSCGYVATSAEKCITMDDMIKTADKDMYRVKAERKTLRK